MNSKEPKYITNRTESTINTGELLKSYFKKNRIRKNALGRCVDRRGATILRYQKNSSIQTAILWEICFALKHNFFNDIASLLPTDFTTDAPLNNDLEKRIASLEDELKIVSAERDVLLKAIGK